MAPAAAKSGTMRSTGFTIRCSSIGARHQRLRNASQTSGPIVRFGDVVVVHHVEVGRDLRRPRATGVDLLAEPREVGRKIDGAIQQITSESSRRSPSAGAASLYHATRRSAPMPAAQAAGDGEQRSADSLQRIAAPRHADDAADDGGADELAAR